MFLGIDCGTQGTKVLLWDADSQTVLATSYSTHRLISKRQGQKEQFTGDWLTAMQAGVRDVIQRAGIVPSAINGIGVSGQQHGLVILDQHDAVIRPAKLWCDTEGDAELADYLRRYRVVYNRSLSSDIGIPIPIAFTLGKILWLKQYEADSFSRMQKVMLPHEYLNYFLTGEFKAEPGDASGTGYFDTRSKTWCPSAVAMIGDDFMQKLPAIIPSHEVHGYLSARAAAYLGLPAGICVSSGGGDNMMSAIGTGNVSAGRLTMSLGTSGTLSTTQPAQIDSSAYTDLNTFCSSTGGWLPLISTMNLTSAINTFRQLMDIDIADFDNYLLASKPGADGLFSFPWLNGARLPDLPGAMGEITGMTTANFTKPHLLRSVVEGASFNLCKGIEIFKENGLVFDSVSVTGGGSNSTAWCTMIANITGMTVTRQSIPAAAALGAAIQAHWCTVSQSAGKTIRPISACLPEWLIRPSGECIEPSPDAVAQYHDIYQRYQSEVERIKQRYRNGSAADA